EHTNPAVSELFITLGKVHSLKDPPAHPREIRVCTPTSEACKIADSVRAARNTLMETGRVRALQNTLRQMEQSCDNENMESSIDVRLTCLGTLAALVMFAQPDEDLLILNFLKNRPSLIRTVVNRDFPWLYNRHYNHRWMLLAEKHVESDYILEIAFTDNAKPHTHAERKLQSAWLLLE
ncbi:MAG: hypothetical protein AAGF11_49225, partial [Myxococcota bacterium]